MAGNASVSRSTRAVAKLQARDVERAVARSGVLASRLYATAAQAIRARRSADATSFQPFDEELVDAVVRELTDVMSYSYLLRRKLTNRRRATAKSIVLASPVHTLAAKIADQFDIDLGNVARRFEPTAKKGAKAALGDIRDTMNRALSQATRQELTVDDATDYVLDAVKKLGVQPRGSSYVETLVRTHSAIAYGAAHRAQFSDDPDLWGFEYVTVGDDRVRPEHEALDGTRRKADDEFWTKFWPPNGWNCRCQAVAIYDDATRQTRVPDDVEPDEGFDTDFQELLD